MDQTDTNESCQKPAPPNQAEIFRNFLRWYLYHRAVMYMKLKKGTFKHIESELYAYEVTKKEIEQIREEILHSTPRIDNPEGRANTPSDPTATTATLLMNHRRLDQLERIAKAIEQIYQELPDDKKKLIKLKYWTKPQTKAWEGIAQEINISRRQAL